MIDEPLAMLINGQRVTTEKTFPVINPETEEVIAEAPEVDVLKLRISVVANRRQHIALGVSPRKRGKHRLAAKRRQQFTPCQFAVTASRLSNSFRSNSLGLRPRLSAVATTWLEKRNFKRPS